MKGTVGPAMLKIDLALAERFRRVCPHWAKYILELAVKCQDVHEELPFRRTGLVHGVV